MGQIYLLLNLERRKNKSSLFHYHFHPFEHLNYIIEGEGAVVTESGDERPVKRGIFVLVLPAENHQYKNTSSKDPVVIVCGVPKEYE